MGDAGSPDVGSPGSPGAGSPGSPGAGGPGSPGAGGPGSPGAGCTRYRHGRRGRRGLRPALVTGAGLMPRPATRLIVTAMMMALNG